MSAIIFKISNKYRQNPEYLKIWHILTESDH